MPIYNQTAYNPNIGNSLAKTAVNLHSNIGYSRTNNSNRVPSRAMTGKIVIYNDSVEFIDQKMSKVSTVDGYSTIQSSYYSPTKHSHPPSTYSHTPNNMSSSYTSAYTQSNHRILLYMFICIDSRRAGDIEHYKLDPTKSYTTPTSLLAPQSSKNKDRKTLVLDLGMYYLWLLMDVV